LAHIASFAKYGQNPAAFFRRKNAFAYRFCFLNGVENIVLTALNDFDNLVQILALYDGKQDVYGTVSALGLNGGYAETGFVEALFQLGLLRGEKPRTISVPMASFSQSGFPT
jgi:hypothetical protein